jgi:hypothetical protein
MTEPAGTNDPTGGGHPGLPRWVKMSAVILAVAVLLAIAATLIAGVDHGPGRHGSGRHLAGLTPAQAMPG